MDTAAVKAGFTRLPKIRLAGGAAEFGISLRVSVRQCHGSTPGRPTKMRIPMPFELWRACLAITVTLTISVAPIAVTPIAAQEPEYQVTLIEYDGPGLPPFNMVATAINEAGVVVGWAQFSLPAFTTRAWVWTATSGMQLLPVYSGGTAAHDVNASGVIVGGDGGPFGSGWIFENGQFSSIGTLGSDPASEATGINDAGQVCGTSVTMTISAPDRAVLYEAGAGLLTLTPIESSGEAINNLGQIAGSAGNQAFRWSPGIGIEFLGPLPPAYDFSFARDINDDGQVTGYLSAAGTTSRRAFLYTDGVGIAQLPTPGGNAIGWGMNRDGHVVGEADTPNTAWVWSPTQGVRDLSTLIDPALAMQLLLATDVNDFGMIVATTPSLFTPGGSIARVALLTPTGAGSVDGPQGLDCVTGPDSVLLSWSVPAAYDTLEVARDGEVIATLDPTELSFVDTSVPLGPHTYRVRGEFLGGADVSDAAFCSVDIDGLLAAPETFTCAADDSTVELTWSAPVPYDVTRVERDGNVIAELIAGETSFTDFGVAVGLHEYRVSGEIGGVDSVAATCNVVVAAQNTVLVYSPIGVSGVSGVTDELVNAGVSFVETNDFDTVDLTAFDAVFAVFGVNPLGVPLTVAEGQSLADFVVAGGALYIEGGDIWATSAINPFHAIDGVYAVYAGGSFDTDEIEGHDAGPILDLSPFGAIAYSGPDQSLDWLGADSPFAHPLWTRTVNDVNLGMLYAPPTQGPIIECSFQLGGISDPTTRSDVFAAYLDALGVSVGPGAPLFRRGDANGDTAVDISDAVALLAYLFQSAAALPCDAAADTNDDGGLTIADPISLLTTLFAGSGPLPAPYPDCGADATPDSLTCASSSCP